MGGGGGGGLKAYYISLHNKMAFFLWKCTVASVRVSQLLHGIDKCRGQI